MPTDSDQERISQDRNRLALMRTRLANERTMLAYARTAIMVAATGATLLKLFADDPLSVASGWILVAIAILLAGLGLRRYGELKRRLD